MVHSQEKAQSDTSSATPAKFNLRCKQLFLTWPQCSTPKEQVSLKGRVTNDSKYWTYGYYHKYYFLVDILEMTAILNGYAFIDFA